MKVLHYYPAPLPNGKYLNPYSIYYRDALSKYFKVIDTGTARNFLVPILLIWSALFRANIFLFNWIENLSFKRVRFVQFLLIMLCFKIIKWKRKKLVWMFHNMHPHAGESTYSERIMNYLFRHADLIIAHSNEAKRYAQNKTNHKVIYRCHPVPPICKKDVTADHVTYDILIWGTILPYKGVVEFLSFLKKNHSKLKVHVVGKCYEDSIVKSIEKLVSNNISYSNKHAEMSELQELIQQSRYVVFPYIGTSISSSGALIDTIARGGNCVGPNKGAFKDLAEVGCCLVYDNYEHLLNIIDNHRHVAAKNVNDFLEKNTWENYVLSILPDLLN